MRSFETPRRIATSKKGEHSHPTTIKMPLLSSRTSSRRSGSPAPPPPPPPLEPVATVISSDLNQKLAAWEEHSRALYANSVPAASVSVTVLAATGLPSSEPYWIASVNGYSSETGLPTVLETAVKGEAPRGAPSWSMEPLNLPVYDLTSDVLLLLCDGAPGDATNRRCVGRVVLPLSDLLPLNPLGCGEEPQPLQVRTTLHHASTTAHTRTTLGLLHVTFLLPGLGAHLPAGALLLAPRHRRPNPHAFYHRFK